MLQSLIGYWVYMCCPDMCVNKQALAAWTAGNFRLRHQPSEYKRLRWGCTTLLQQVRACILQNTGMTDKSVKHKRREREKKKGGSHDQGNRAALQIEYLVKSALCECTLTRVTLAVGFPVKG